MYNCAIGAYYDENSYGMELIAEDWLSFRLVWSVKRIISVINCYYT